MVLKNLPPLAGLTFNCNACPTLTRRATFYRRYAAVFGCASRDILDSSGHRPLLEFRQPAGDQIYEADATGGRKRRQADFAML